jgi:hypothetical protein
MIFHLDDKSWPKCCDWLLLTLPFVPLIQNRAPDPSGVIDRDPVLMQGLMQGFHQDIWGIWGWIMMDQYPVHQLWIIVDI